VKSVSRNAWLFKAVAVAALTLACAQADAQAPAPLLDSGLPPSIPADTPAPAPPLIPAESVKLKQAVDAAQAGDLNTARQVQAALADPLARRIVQWAMADSAASMMGFYDLDAARRDLTGWPRASRRQAGAERAIEIAGLSPQSVVEWFGGKAPDTAEGAMALASAYQILGRGTEAQALIRQVWREKTFEADVQTRMMARFAAFLTPEDYAKRLDLLLYGPQGPATQALMDMVDPETRAVAQARIAFRSNRDDAPQVFALVPLQRQNDPGLAFERARYLRKRGLDTLAAGLIPAFAAPPLGYPGGTELMWNERRALMMSLLRAGDAKAAYAAATNCGFPIGEAYTEAEFFAGWIALRKLNDPTAAAEHFANIERAGSSPITVSRALYWQGRAAEAAGEDAAAQRYWSEGAKYYTAFYGQLSAQKIGQNSIVLPSDPTITASDRARFEGRDLVRAARMLADAGETDLFRVFVLAADDTLPSAEELALLVDMARLYGDQDLAMRVVRTGAVRGLYLPERGYPVRNVPQDSGAPEPALIHAIVRQESGFDPRVRSGVGAQGMMQLMPGTARGVAKKLGLPYSDSKLNDADFNMKLGSAYLGQLVQNFSGSYVMAAAGYNAGPGRPSQWAADCGDPRGGTTDPSDFIECIPFSETRNYVMRIMEAVQVYRARLNGGAAPLTAAADLKRGGWVPGAPSYEVLASASSAAAQ